MYEIFPILMLLAVKNLWRRVRLTDIQGDFIHILLCGLKIFPTYSAIWGSKNYICFSDLVRDVGIEEPCVLQ